MEALEATFHASPAAPRAARLFLRTALATQDLDGLGEVTELLTTELVANVVRHVGSDATVRVVPIANGIRVEVDDVSRRVPIVEHPDNTMQSGRGILLVDELANRWGTTLRPGGKTVWFEIDAGTAAREVHGERPN